MTARSYLFSGPNGVGKSTIINHLTQAAPNRFKHIRGSTVLMQCLGVSSYEDLAKFPKDYKNMMADEAMVEVLKQPCNDDILLIDSHMLFFDHGQVSSSTTPWVRQVSGIVAVEADERVVYERIRTDAEAGIRERSILPDDINDETLAIALLAGYIATSKAYTRAFGIEHGIPTMEIDNTEHPAQAAQRFIEGFLPDFNSSCIDAIAGNHPETLISVAA